MKRTGFFAATMVLLAAACGDDDALGATQDGGPDAAVDGGMGSDVHSCEEPGGQGCSCDAEERCDVGSHGEQLMCVGGLCEAASCESGQRGCVCRYGSQCSAEDDRCSEGFCRPLECEAGAEFCGCADGSCAPGLYCQNGVICLEATGKKAGACRSNGGCERGNRCDTSLRICVPCELGDAGCACEDGRCGEGLSCQADLCTVRVSGPPDNPACYTPCRADLVTPAGVRRCDAEGLLEGCLDGLECEAGSCVRPGDAPPTCKTDLDCPSFQTCLAGGCYSDCQANADCPAGQGCLARVCRTPCGGSSGASDCGPGFSCDARDGAHGFCTPVGANSAEPSVLPAGGFRVNEQILTFSNIDPEVSLPIITDGPFSQEVRVRKLWHRAYYADGTEEEVLSPVDADSGEPRACDAAKNECPLHWLVMSDGDTSTQGSALTVKVPGGCETIEECPHLTLSGAGDVDVVRWEGELELCSQSGCSAPVTMSYIERPEGQWSGELHYYGTFGDEGLSEWVKDKGRSSGVGNALIRKWSDFRSGGLSGGWDEFLAILTSTREGSWDFGAVKERCDSPACYPYTNAKGVRTYSDNLTTSPIPTGETRFPMAVNLKVVSGRRMEGRIESSSALQYAGNPKLVLDFVADPADGGACDSAIAGDCVVFVEKLAADIVVGGRYYTDGSGCERGYAPNRVPWLLPGFEQGTTSDGSGRRYRHECRDAELPYAEQDSQQLNVGLSGANPVPDGKERKRTLRLLDGALINQSLLFVLFEEEFDSFIPGGAKAAAYGYMLLRKNAATLSPEDFEGRAAPETTRSPQALGMRCSQDLLDKVSFQPEASELPALAEADLDLLVTELMDGPTLSAPDGMPAVGWEVIDPANVHWFCEETGLIDGGAHNDGLEYYEPADLLPDGSPRDGAVPLPRVLQPWSCPDWSKVTFFSIDPDIKSQADLAALPCNQLPNEGPDLGEDESDSDSCHDVVESMRSGVIDVYEPHYECSDGRSFCNPADGLDYLANKTFYRQVGSGVGETLPPVLTSIAQAFRYKIRFQSSSGGSLGFAPQQCIPGSDQIPYCYEPAVIEELRGRLDCLVDIYSNHAPGLSAGTADSLNEFLRGSFSSFKQPGTTLPIHEGFERLYAELLVMLGDDALTAAYASRFDLAGSGGAAFEGSLFERGGIDLTGVAGFEMVSLYRAVQYYQLALDRLYQMGPNYAAALGRSGSTDDTTVFVSPATVTDYIERLVRAATQKARALGEIAKHYQEFNRADLARAVIERSYSGTYLESVMLSNLMVSIQLKSTDRSLDQIRLEIERAQLRYRMALLEMRDIYATINDSVTYFGFAPDYIPLPALDSAEHSQSAYQALSATARQKVQVASVRELTALESNRSQRTDTASFQAELVRVRNTYENQLADICGTFEGLDGAIYPATRKYAHLSDEATLHGDPCGRMGNGALYTAMADVDKSGLSLRGALQHHTNIVSQVGIQQRLVSRQCGINDELVAIDVERRDERKALDVIIGASTLAMSALSRASTHAKSAIRLATCEPPSVVPPSLGTCPSSMAAATGAIAINATADAAVTAGEALIFAKELEIADLESQRSRARIEHDCAVAQVDSLARVDTLVLGLAQAELEAMRANYAIQLQLANVTRLGNEAQRLMAQQEQAEQLLVDVEAARNDPNVRIYRNDAVWNADLAFDDALRAVYRATRVFEYYTSQSYAKRDQLFLMRMVTAGQYNLENYLVELDNAFFEFGERFGAPDRRVQILSLRDDIMQIPLMDDRGRPYSRGERIERMREQLRDVKLLDSRGYLELPFSTSLGTLSPLTRNHKLRFVEVDVVGSDVGDTLGRVYLRAAGTGAVHNLAGDKDYYTFPERTAVIDTFFNGNRVFDPGVYRSARLRDRPLVNTLWEFVINQRDEEVNEDIDLQSLTDIRLLLHYTDFTTLQ